MKQLGTPEITTDRLILRRFQPDDAPTMYDNWASLPSNSTYLTWHPHQNLAETQAVVDFWVTEYADDGNYHWGIALKDNPEVLIGDLKVMDVNCRLNSCGLGYVLGQAYWGQGYMTEAVKAVLDFLLREADFNRVFAVHDVANPASGRVMAKAGMTFEGIQRQADINVRGLVDIAVYAIIKADLAD